MHTQTAKNAMGGVVAEKPISVRTVMMPAHIPTIAPNALSMREIVRNGEEHGKENRGYPKPSKAALTENSFAHAREDSAAIKSAQGGLHG